MVYLQQGEFFTGYRSRRVYIAKSDLLHILT